MRALPSAILLLVLTAPLPVWAAGKPTDAPDKEMLRMMEFLREVEMIKQLDIMRDMHDVESLGEPAKVPDAQKPSGPKKESAK